MKKFFVFLLVVICLGMGAGVVYMKSSEDNEGPKITFEEGKDTNYTSDMTEEDLLKDVKAQDDRDGDVTESLTVETIYPKNDGKQVSVIFVAKDKNNNVTKKEFTMEAQDGSAENPQLGLIDNDGLTEDGDSTDTTEPAEETDMQDGTEADSTDAESGDSAGRRTDSGGTGAEDTGRQDRAAFSAGSKDVSDYILRRGTGRNYAG